LKEALKAQQEAIHEAIVKEEQEQSSKERYILDL